MVSKATKGDIEEPGEIQIQDAERKPFSLAERGAGAQGFQSFNSALTTFDPDRQPPPSSATARSQASPQAWQASTPQARRSAQVRPHHPCSASIDGKIRACRPTFADHAAKSCRLRSTGPNGRMKTDEAARSSASSRSRRHLTSSASRILA